VTVNTDDPGVFTTSIDHEYYLLAEVLLDQGVPESEVVDWLEWLRQNGKDYSFVRDLPDFDDPRIQEILGQLEKLNRSVVPALNGQRRSLAETP
jgi:hypothetical protein